MSILLALAALAPFVCAPARAASVTLAWLPSTDPDVAGYHLHYGGATQTYTNVVAVGGATNATISGLLPGAEYFFAATAVDGAGRESQFSNEIAYQVPGGSAGSPPVVVPALFSYITNNNGTITITGYTGPGGALVIPGTIAGLPVTSIGNDAFDGCTNLAGVTIPNSVTSIGDDAFYGCSTLISVAIPNSVTSIGEGAFSWCASLPAVAIPNSVTRIGQNAFGSCSALTAIAVDALNSFYSSTPDGVLFNKNQTLLIQCPGGKRGTYTVPNSVTGIGSYAFYGCSSLTSLTIPTGVTSIGEGAFIACSSLSGVYLQGNAPTYDPSAFAGDFASVYYLAGTTGWQPAFAGLPALVWDPVAQAAYFTTNGAITVTKYTGPGGSVAIPGTIAGLPVTGIGSSAFASCISLTNVTLPSTVTSIEDWAFSACTSLARVTMPDSLTSIGDWAFEDCANLAGVTIPNSVTSIGEGAFDSCASMTTATIGNSVTNIGNYAFESCTRLAAVTLPNSLASIGGWAFASCASLSSVTLPNNLASIGDEAFGYCAGLGGITIPSSVTNIGNSAFTACSNLAAITVDALNPVYSSLGGVLFNKGQTVLIECPPGMPGAYTLPNTVTSIGDQAFVSCTSLTSVTIPNSVTSIGGGAFDLCANLANVTIGNGVTAIGEGAFELCTNLASVTIPNSVTSIGNRAFDGCSNLKALYFQGNAPTCGSSAFLGDAASVYYLVGTAGWGPTFAGLPASLWDPLAQAAYTTTNGAIAITKYTGPGGAVAIPGKINGQRVASIGDWAFSFCASLTSVTIPNSVTSIGSNAFAYCTSLTNIAIPDSVTTVGNEAFAYCTSLASITIPKGLTNLGNGEFAWCVSLTAITVDALNPVYSSLDGVLFNKSRTMLIEYPPGIAGTYAPPGSVTSIGDGAFEYCTNLTGITLSNNVTSIGEGAFDFCTALATATIGEHVTNIGGYAFAFCIKLAGVTLPKNVTSIGDWAFNDCTNLTGVYFQGSPPACDSSAFGGDAAIAYYLAGSTGWGPTFAGLSASLWDPVAQAAYTVANGAVTITKYTGPGGSVTLPATITGLPVTSIGDWAFSRCANLTGITLPNSVTSIGYAAFYDCTGLSNITLPNSVASIGDWAFSFCASLTNIALPNSLANVGNWVFEHCASLASVALGNSVAGIGEGAFDFCSSLASVTLPKSVSSIGYQAFGDCPSLTEVFFEGNPPTTDSSAFLHDEATACHLAAATGWGPTFAGLPGSLWDPVAQAAYTAANGAITITKYTGPGGPAFIPATIAGLPVTSIGGPAFYGCATLTGVTIPNTVTNIGNSAFYGCSSLASITLPDSVASIGDWAFVACTNLSTVTLPDNLTSIGNEAFAYCTGLTNIAIPSSVTDIGNMEFAWCLSLTNITVDPLNPVYSSVDGALFDKSRTVLIEFPPGTAGAYALPDGVASIRSWAFGYCINLTAVTIANSVTNIGEAAFYDCFGLTNAIIGNSVTLIDEWAFDDCTNLTGVFFQGKPPAYDPSAFWGVNATAYYVAATPGWGQTYAALPTSLWDPPAQVAYIITNGAVTVTLYTGSGGPAVIPATITGLPVTRIGASAFSDAYALTSITLPNSITSIGDAVFYQCAGLTNITIPEGVASIGSDAFEYCTGLTNIALPNSITSIGDWAFAACTNLAGVTFPNGAASIGNAVFYYCTGLTNITIPNSVRSIGNDAFGYCTGLANITIPNSVTNIGGGAFAYCSSLASLAIPNGLTSIPPGLFDYCSNLTSVTIPGSVTSFGDDVFDFCTSLTNITLPASVTNVGNLPLAWCPSLAAITVDPLNPVYSSVDGVLFDKSQTLLIECPPVKTGPYTLPNSVESIGDWAFGYCTNLTSVTIGSSVTNVGNEAFYGCVGVSNFYFEGDAPALGSAAFSYDSAMVNYLPGTTGWGDTFGDLSTQLWQNGPPVMPTITLQPQSQTVNAGDTATFTVAAAATPPLGYQWLFNARAIPRATKDSYTINTVQAPAAGSYSVVVSNIAGSATSDMAVLTVAGAQYSALALPPITLLAAASDASSNTYVLGLFTHTLNFGGASLVSHGGTDYVLAQYRPDGRFGWAVSFGTPQDEPPGSTLTVASNGVFVAGTTPGSIRIVDTAGNTVNTAYTGGQGGFLFCFSFTGVAVWQASVNGASGTNAGPAVASDAQGNIYWAGVFNGCCPSPGGGTLTGGDGTSVALSTPGDASGFLAKLSPAGTPLWTATAYNRDAAFNNVAVDSSGAVVVAGYSRSSSSGTATTLIDAGGKAWPVSNPGFQSSFAAKFDTSGIYQWSVFSTGSPDAVKYLVWQSMTAATNGDILLGGSYNTTGVSLSAVNGVAQSLPAPNGQDGFVAALNSSGSVKWLTQIGGSGTDVVNSVSVGSSGGITAAGQMTAGLSLVATNIAGLGGADGFVAMLDQNGTVTNAFALGGPGNDDVLSVIAGTSGYDLIAGNEGAGFAGLGVQMTNAGPFVLAPSPVPAAPQLECPANITTNMVPGQCEQVVSFAATVTAGSPPPLVTYQLGGLPITSPYVFPAGQNIVSVTASNSVGADTCDFIVTVVDDELPIAGSNEMSTSQGSPAVVQVAGILLNCTSPLGRPLSITSAASPTANGAIVTLAGGQITYAPPAGFVGQDTLNYTLSDGCGAAPGSITVFVMPNNPSTLTYQLSTPVSGSLSMGIWDVYDPVREGGQQQGVSAGVGLNFETLTETVYLDSAAGTIRQVGFISVAPSATNIVLSINETQQIPNHFPTPPQTVSGQLSVTLNLVASGIYFDTGPQPMTWDPVNQVYAFGADLTNSIPFAGSYSLATGGQTYTGTFSYVVQTPAGWLHSFAFSQASAANYPASLLLSGLGDNGGASAYLPPQSIAVNPKVPPPIVVADVLATNGFHLQLAPGTSLNGEWGGYLFSWSSPPVMAVNTNGLTVAPVVGAHTAQVTPPPKVDIALVGGQPHLAWSALLGWRYQVWFKDALANGSWMSAGSVLTASGDTLEFIDSPPGGTSARFYRVQVLGPP